LVCSPRVQARHVQQAVEELLGRSQGGVDAFAQVALLGRFDAVAQRRGEQPRGVERLQHVVADRRQEAGLGLLRRLGLAAAVGHALLEGFIGLEQGILGALEIADVVVAGHVAAALQRLAAHLDHRAVAAHALEDVRRAGAYVLDALGHLVFDPAFAQLSAFGVVADQVGDGAAHVKHARRIPEHPLVAAVPGHQAHVQIDHADAGADVLQGGA